jgi:hypothetical protein
MKEAYAVRRTVPPRAEIQAEIDKLLAKGLVDDPRKMLGELGRLGARLIIQRAVEEEFDSWLGRARYERRPERLSLVWAVLDLFFSHASNGATFTDVDREHLYRIKYQQADPDTLDEEVTAA